MLIYNQRPRQSLSKHSHPEVHHGENILGMFLKQYSNERR